MLEKVEMTFFEKPEEHHAEQVFKNADRGENVEKTILGVVTVEPKVIGKTEESGPQNARNKEGSKKYPKRAVTLLEKPTAEPRRHGIAYEKAGKGPRRFIQFHAEIGHNGPGERQMQEKATPRMCHLGKARRSAVANFIQGWQMRVTAELEHKHHKHEERHEEVQAVKLCNATEHEGDYGDLAIGIAKLACEKKTR